MNVVAEFAIDVIKGSGLISSILLSCITVLSIRSGESNGTLAKQASGFLALFLASLLVYLVM
jgi:hypothetical protein